jgi:hypothetical protein
MGGQEHQRDGRIRAWKRLTGATARGWLLVGTLLGVGALPCPECGAPMICHFWPIAGFLLVVQVLKRRHGGVSPAEDEEQKGEQKRCDHDGQESSLTITVRRFDS